MFLVQFSYVKEFRLEGHLSAQYSAFAQTLIMLIAKWIGTLATTLTMGILSTNYIVLACGLPCTIYKLWY